MSIPLFEDGVNNFQINTFLNHQIRPMKILILCTGNTCRSQMAQGFIKAFDDFIDVYSAGTKPDKQVNPYAVKVMREMGIDISENQPESADDYTDKAFDYVITVCDEAKEICPIFTGEVKNQLHIGFEDPADAKGTEEEVLPVYRRIRDEILVDFFAFYQTELK